MDYLIGIVLMVGAFFAMAAGLGILRLPDVLIRMHASTKAGTLGAGLVLLAAVVYFLDWAVTVRIMAIMVFLMATAPIGAHMMGRASLRAKVPLYKIKAPTPKKAPSRKVAPARE